MTEQMQPRSQWIDFAALYQKANAIARAYYSGNLVFFLGAGASKSYRPAMPSWLQLIQLLKAELLIPNVDQKEINDLIAARRYTLAAEALLAAADVDVLNRDEALKNAVKKILSRYDQEKSDPVLPLSILDFGVPIFTTNFDTIIEDLIVDNRIRTYGSEIYTYTDETAAARLQSPTRDGAPYIFKLHGSIAKEQSLILTESNYFDFYFRQRWPTSLQLLRHILATKMVIFIGFSLTDPEIMLILREATRYASAYQHLALMRKADVTSIEDSLLQKHYKVDTILYNDFEELPQYVMEMRDFYRQDEIPIRFRSQVEILMPLLIKKRDEFQLGEDCIIIIFGSYARYGSELRAQSDIDILFLPYDEQTLNMAISDELTNQALDRRMDVTVLYYGEFLNRLRLGDPFVSSVLATGYAVNDPFDDYGTLSRGFRGHYRRDDILANIQERYESRWLRICFIRKVNSVQQRRAVYQWLLTVMQYLIIQDGYPIEDILTASLLSKPTFLFQRFDSLFGGLDETFIRLMFDLKNSPADVTADRLNLDTLVSDYREQLVACGKQALGAVLYPGEFLTGSDQTQIYNVFMSNYDLIKELAGYYGDSAIGDAGGSMYMPLQSESDFISALNQTSTKITAFDYLFFVKLYLLFEEHDPETEQQENMLLEQALILWRQAQNVDFLQAFSLPSDYLERPPGLPEMPDEPD